jgi:predicted AAA+ superfamily ATPase
VGQLTRLPKIYLVDPGLAFALAGFSDQYLQKERNPLGCLLESFVFSEIRKQASWQPDRLELLHFRDKKKTKWTL